LREIDCMEGKKKFNGFDPELKKIFSQHEVCVLLENIEKGINEIKISLGGTGDKKAVAELEQRAEKLEIELAICKRQIALMKKF
jgi:hypothetical protein